MKKRNLRFFIQWSNDPLAHFVRKRFDYNVVEELEKRPEQAQYFMCLEEKKNIGDFLLTEGQNHVIIFDTRLRANSANRARMGVVERTVPSRRCAK